MAERLMNPQRHGQKGALPELASAFSQRQTMNSISRRVSDQASSFLSKVDRQLNEVDALQSQWDSMFGMPNDPQRKEVVQYNPVLARWNWERTSTAEEKEQFKRVEVFNIKTALRERNNTERSDLYLYFDQRGKIRNEAYLKEPWEDVLERGVAYCKKEYPAERARVEAEKEGFLRIQEEFSKPDAKNGTIAFVISPPGFSEGSIFDHNFVDGYQLMIDEATGRRRAVPYTRFSSPLDYDAYKTIATEIDSHYFERKTQQEKLTGENIPDDAWFLGNPFFFSPDDSYKNIEDVFNKHFEKDIKAMETAQFEELWKVYLPYVLFYVDQLTKPDFDPVAVAKAWNTVHHSVENKDLNEETKEIPIFIASERTVLDTQTLQRVAGMVDRFGTQEVEKKQVGCGSSGGFTIGEKGSSFTNSASRFGLPEGNGSSENYDFDHEGTCVVCNSGPKLLGPCDICIPCDAQLGGKGAELMGKVESKKDVALAA